MTEHNNQEVPFGQRPLEVILAEEHLRMSKPYDRYPKDMPLDREPNFYTSKGYPVPNTPREVKPEKPGVVLGNVFLGARLGDERFIERTPSAKQVLSLINHLRTFEESQEAKNMADALSANFANELKTIETTE